VLSWLVLLGKCRKCKTKISPIYPIIEFITGVLFVLVYLKFGLTVETFFYILLSSLMVIISVSDIDTRLIPNKILGVFLVLLLPVTYFVEAIDWKSQLIGVVLAFAINYLILLFSKGKGMGGGDIKLFMLLALVLGWKSFITLFFLSVVIGMFVGIYTKVRTKESEIPFGPSIALATIITIFYGQELLKWYLNLYI
jgi:leader peptidase (prepilin peptidase)/N-methyltransferase